MPVFPVLRSLVQNLRRFSNILRNRVIAWLQLLETQQVTTQWDEFRAAFYDCFILSLLNSKPFFLVEGLLWGLFMSCKNMLGRWLYISCQHYRGKRSECVWPWIGWVGAIIVLATQQWRDLTDTGTTDVKFVIKSIFFLKNTHI